MWPKKNLKIFLFVEVDITIIKIKIKISQSRYNDNNGGFVEQYLLSFPPTPLFTLSGVLSWCEVSVFCEVCMKLFSMIDNDVSRRENNKIDETIRSHSEDRDED